MGWKNYVVSPKLKLMFSISRDVEEEAASELGKKLADVDCDDTVDSYGWTAKNLSEQKIADVAKVIDGYELTNDYHLVDKLFFFRMKGYDKATYIISGMDEKMVGSLLENGYKVVDYEETI